MYVLHIVIWSGFLPILVMGSEYLVSLVTYSKPYGQVFPSTLELQNLIIKYFSLMKRSTQCKYIFNTTYTCKHDEFLHVYFHFMKLFITADSNLSTLE